MHHDDEDARAVRAGTADQPGTNSAADGGSESQEEGQAAMDAAEEATVSDDD